jgi:hypothetical protein
VRRRAIGGGDPFEREIPPGVLRGVRVGLLRELRDPGAFGILVRDARMSAHFRSDFRQDIIVVGGSRGLVLVEVSRRVGGISSEIAQSFVGVVPPPRVGGLSG